MAKPWIYRRCGIGKTGENPETHEQYEMCPALLTETEGVSRPATDRLI